MEIKGVITGDIINSSDIKGEDRTKLLSVIDGLVAELKKITLLKIEIYRGDSFQIHVDNPSQALKIAILIRAKLRSYADKKWDTRLAVGIGSIDFESKNVVTSDGEAYLNSGREFDKLGKKKLGVCTPWSDFNNELLVSTAFADNIISKWTSKQSKSFFLSVSRDITQKQLAEEMNTKPQNISQTLLKANESLIIEYIKRYESVINTRTK